MSTRIPLFAANWKMHKTVRETIAFVREFGPAARQAASAELVIAPPFTALAAAVEAARGMPIEIAAQDVFFEREGAYTGEISAGMLKDLGVSYVIVGHSERRRLFGETDEWVKLKVGAALEAGLGVIVCIGETLPQREQGQTLAVLDRQIATGLASVTSGPAASLVIAYEPVWAIGTGRNATPAQAAEAHAHIRARIREAHGAAAADRCRILYGGSVKPANIRELIDQPDVDGALVGGASLDVSEFAEIVQRGSLRP
jgi:triosephosphate isomerase